MNDVLHFFLHGRVNNCVEDLCDSVDIFFKKGRRGNFARHNQEENPQSNFFLNAASLIQPIKNLFGDKAIFGHRLWRGRWTPLQPEEKSSPPTVLREVRLVQYTFGHDSISYGQHRLAKRSPGEVAEPGAKDLINNLAAVDK